MRLYKMLPTLALLGLLAAPRPASADMFENKAKQIAAEIVTNPSQFFFDFQKDMESLNPLPAGKWFGVNWHIGQFLLVPIPDPTTINVSGKIRLHQEGRLLSNLPQIDVIGGYWTAGPAIEASGAVDKDATAADADTKIKKADFSGHYIGTVMTSSLEPRVRLFWGWKMSQMKSEIELNKAQDFIGTPVSSFKTGFKDHFLFAGMEHPTAVNKWWNIQMFYGLQTNDFGAKVSWYKKNFELGLNIYPEGTFVIHPVLNFHVNFG